MAGNFPKAMKYTADHEWLRLDGDGSAVAGITDYAQEALGDIVFVELPEVGDELSKGDVLGVVESVKTTSDIYMPVSGVITAVNDALEDAPETVNEDPHGNGWLVKFKPSNKDDLGELLDADAYGKHVSDQDH